MNLPVIQAQLGQMGEEVATDQSISNRTLFIRGLKSDYIEVPEDLKLIQTLFPNYQMEELDAGHWLHSEKPEEFLEIVNEFLSEA